jgi:hypothetical protein
MPSAIRSVIRCGWAKMPIETESGIGVENQLNRKNHHIITPPHTMWTIE